MIVALVGRSGAGKTWVLERLIPLLKARGLSVAVLKHTHHELWQHKPGSDTERLARAGADPVGLCGPGGHTWYGPEEPVLPQADIVLLEGFKSRPDVTRIEVVRGGPPMLTAAELWATVGDEVPGVRRFGFEQLELLAQALGQSPPA